MKLLWSANAPWCPTGYGTQSQYILPRLAGLPEIDDITIHAFYGLQGGRIRYRMSGRDWTVLPTIERGADLWSNETVSNYAKEFQSDVVISLHDVWPLKPDFGRDFRWLPYAPIDCSPIPQVFKDRFTRAYIPLVYSKYGQKSLEEVGIESIYLPLGVDTKTFRPLKGRRRMRRSFGWPEESLDAIIFGMIAANQGYPARKGFPEAFEALSKLHASGHDAWIYVHNCADGSAGGIDLYECARSFGVQNRILTAHKHLLLSGAYDAYDLCRLYNCFDALLGPSYSEGFGIPIIEAQACNTPVIVTDAFAMTELCGMGIKVPWDHKHYVPIGANYVMPNVDAITDALEEVCEERFIGDISGRKFATKYDWDVVFRDYWVPFIQRLDRELTPRHYTLKTHQNGLIQIQNGQIVELDFLKEKYLATV